MEFERTEHTVVSYKQIEEVLPLNESVEVLKPFEEFEVAISDEYTYQLEVTLVGVRHPTEEMRQFVEDAIREKLERL